MNPNSARLHTKTKTPRLFAQVCCITFLVILIQCAPNDNNLTGTGSQVGNGRVACTVYNSDGSPASGATVHLRTHDYTVSTALKKSAVSRCDAYTDEHGMFRIDSIDTGNYYIEVNDGKSHATLLTCAIKGKDTLVNIPSDTLQPTGTITGILAPSSSDSIALYIQIYGLERIGEFDSVTRGFIIKDIPRGNYTIRILASSADYAPMEIKDVNAASNKTTDIGKIDIINQSQWQYSKQLYLNTSPTGANVAGAVTNFPVLIRLRENNFDFSKANADGSDLRFTNAGEKSLPHQIERWDAVNREAEIWVKLDTVYGNDSTHFISMYWGNTYAADSSNGPGVFDTAAGFTGVWHLGENGENINDATGDAFNGENSGTTKAPGIIGNSRRFADGNYIKISGLLKSPSNVTLSAWVQSERTTGGQEVISIGDKVLIRVDDINGVGTAGAYRNDTVTDGTKKYSTVSSGQLITNTGWHYIAFSIDAARHVQTLYIDGAQDTVSFDAKPINYTGLGTDTYIGIHGNNKQIFNFVGQIDEVRVNNTPESPDWIKLCFMNQKEQDLLVRW